MPRDPREWQVELDLQTQLSRAEGSLEIEATFALLNKIRGDGEFSTLGPYQEQRAPARDIQVPVAPPGADIDWNILRARASQSIVWFLERVAPEGEMDYKVIDNKKYENFGNFNYGAVATAFGFSQEAALRGAGLVQTAVDAWRKRNNSDYIHAAAYGLKHAADFLGDPPYGDQEKDQEMIKQGIRYYHEVFLRKFQRTNLEKYEDKLFWSMRREEVDSLLERPRRGINSVWDAVVNGKLQ